MNLHSCRKNWSAVTRRLVVLFLILLGSPTSRAATAISPALREVSGTLSGRVIFTSGGHGWVNFGYWSLQRAPLLEMVEDYGNLDQMNFFVYYCFNAGATVVPLRPVGFQTNEVVLDNTSASVSFVGTWTNITDESVYFGSVGSGFHQAFADSNETALATYTPTIPITSFYPVYTWVPHGANRTNQLYRIRHTGGESTLHIPHHMVGNGWVYLGSYYFDSGSNSASGSVAISNLQPAANTNSVVIADAIRFGNGMSPSGSTYPHGEEGARWWIQNSLGQGQSSSIYLAPGEVADYEDRMARPKMAAEMNRPQIGRTNRLYISFHSNATTGNTNTAVARGTVGLINSTNPTPRQSSLAANISKETQDDLVAMNSQLEYPWYGSRGNTLAGNYFEIENGRLNGEMDATILEVAFHDNVMDGPLLRDPKARNWVARAAYHAVVRYMTNYDAAPAGFLPEPPSNLRTIGLTNGVRISWSLPFASGGSGNATGFVIYRSTNGYGFANPVIVNGATVTNITLTNLTADVDYYLRIAAFNSAGESMPSETAGCRWTANTNSSKILFVNGFNRFDRTTNLRQSVTAQNYQPPGDMGAIERVMPRANNSFDYVVQHGKAITEYGLPFDSCQKQAVTNDLVALTNYAIVVWETGQDLNDNFNSVAQSKITTFLNNYGNLFVSGAGIAYSLDRASGPTAADRAFFNNFLHADLASDAHTNSATYTFVPLIGTIFGGNANGTIDNGTKGIYWVKSPEVLTPVGVAETAITYSGPGSSAAIQYDGSSGGGRVVYFGFPFETITGTNIRAAYMTDALDFLGAARVLTQPQNSSVLRGSNSTFSIIASGILPLSLQWRWNGTNISNATNSTLNLTNVQLADAGTYSVIISNRAGMVTSGTATLTVIVPRPQFSSVQLSGSNVQFILLGESEINYRIEQSTNLLDWSTVTNVVLTNGEYQFSEPITNFQRFFRAVLSD
ncbi:MAG: fibronectin type III domain-containing protein [Verrucomicrobiota bacterium]